MGVVWNPRGVLRGDRSGEACFTTLLVGRALPATWPLHLARLRRDAALLDLEVPDGKELSGRVLRATSLNGSGSGSGSGSRSGPGSGPHSAESTGLARPFGHVGPLGSGSGSGSRSGSGSGGVHRLRIELVAHNGSPLHGPPPDTAVRLVVSEVADHEPGPVTLQTLPSSKGHGGPLATAKLPMMAEHFVLRRQAQVAGFGDVLLTTRDGVWCEAATANLVVGLDNGTLATPGPQAQPLPGTTLAALRAQVAIADLDLDGTSPICWAVLLNAAWGARPVAAIDGRPLSGPPTDLLQLARRLVQPVP